MLFTRILAPAFALFTFGLTASATPAKRSNAQVEAVFTTLNTAIAPILPQFGQLVNNGQASDATVTPLINQLVAALNTANTSLAGLSPSVLGRRQTEAAIASTVAGAVNNIANGLQPLKSNDAAGHIPSIDILLAEVDAALNEVLVGLSVVIDGILVLVGVLLVFLGGVLANLGLGSVAADLGLI